MSDISIKKIKGFEIIKQVTKDERFEICISHKDVNLMEACYEKLMDWLK